MYQESLLKVEYLVHQLFNSQSMRNAQTFLSLFNSKKQKKKHY